jgi:hypothetical protein
MDVADGVWMPGSHRGPPLYLSHPACLGHETGEHPESASRIQAIEAELERRGWLG